MIGNDIIDLPLAKSQNNWQRPGFLQKLFSIEEQAYILNAENPELHVWLLWSMKESVYKSVQRKYNLNRFFNPRAFACRVIKFDSEKARGTVLFRGEFIETVSAFTSNNIHTLTINTEFSLISEIENCRFSLLQKISKHKKIPLESLNIIKSKEGVPKLAYYGETLPIPFSLSHHGAYSSYAVSLNLS